MRQIACLPFNPIMADSYGFRFYFMTVGRVSMTVQT